MINSNETKTYRQLAEEAGVSTVTLRHMRQRSVDLDKIEHTLACPEKARAFRQLWEQLFANRRESISTTQVRYLAALPHSELTELVDRILSDPSRAKEIIRQSQPLEEQAIVKLSGEASKWYSQLAHEQSRSKSQILSEIAELYYNTSNCTTIERNDI